MDAHACVHLVYGFYFVQGLSYVISAMAPAQAAADALKRLVEPISATLERDGAVAGDAKLAQQDLDRLTVIVSHADLTVEASKGKMFSSSDRSWDFSLDRS